MKKVLEVILSGNSLTHGQALEAIDALIDGQPSAEQVAAFLVAMRMKTETSVELSGFVEGLLKRAILLKPTVANEFPDLIDVCGTGGDGAGTFNVSTGAALVLASAGVTVAKHGNKGVSSASGSADVLEALGLKGDLSADSAVQSLREFGVSFMFAPAFHPILARLSSVRKSLGVYTFLNALGPILNPAPLKRQLMGVYQLGLLEKVAHVLHSRGVEEAMVVHGEDGLDEITLSGKTSVAKLLHGKVTFETMTPEDFGLPRATLAEVKGGSPAENAQILVQIFQGEKSPRRNLILLNSAAALLLSKKAASPREAIETVAHAIDSGKTFQLLQRMQAHARNRP